MNYKKYAYDNQKIFGYKVLKIEGELVQIECATCGAKRTLQLKSLYKNKSCIHNNFCCKYYLDIIRKEYNSDIARTFHDFYRRSHERCCNPKNKDYERYKNKFNFKDFTEFFLNCYPIYKDALKSHYHKELTIDRIDGTKPYEVGNIRFVTMMVNLQNKPYINPVRAINQITGKVTEAASFRDLSIKLTGNTNATGALIKNCRTNKLYKKTWKLEYIEA